MHVSIFFVVGDCVMHDAAVVPDEEVIQGPTVTIDGFLLGAVLVEEVEQLFTFPGMQSDDARRVAGVDEKTFSI